MHYIMKRQPVLSTFSTLEMWESCPQRITCSVRRPLLRPRLQHLMNGSSTTTKQLRFQFPSLSHTHSLSPPPSLSLSLSLSLSISLSLSLCQ
jgi:hypothetical protein